jgi:hypothetical protein
MLERNQNFEFYNLRAESGRKEIYDKTQKPKEILLDLFIVLPLTHITPI